MNKEKKKKLLLFLIPFVSTFVIVFALSFALYFFNDEEDVSSSSISESSSQINEVNKWINPIRFEIPNQDGEISYIDVSEDVPFYESAFSSKNTKYVYNKNNPYEYVISVPSSLGENTNNYIYEITEHNSFNLLSKDYYCQSICSTFINYYDNYRIMITPTYYNYVDYLYIRYIPNGINFPIEDVLAYLLPDINSLIIGVDIDELINVDTSNENEIIIQGTINQNSLIHYKNVLKCFDYISDDNNLFINSKNNEVMIDLSVDNQISIIGEQR